MWVSAQETKTSRRHSSVVAGMRSRAMPPTRGDDMTCRHGQHSLVLVMPNARCATYTTRVWWAQSLPRPARLHTLVWRVAAARSPFVTQHTPILMDVVCGHDRVAWLMTHSAHTVLVWRVAILPT